MPAVPTTLAGPTALAVVVLLAVLLPACSASHPGPATCGPIVREALDPNFLIHVLPGAKGVHYRTDPPTSGAHQPAPHLARIQRRPIPRPVQVGLLEAGDVLLQYRSLDQRDTDRLRRLAGGRVVVAPNPSLSARVKVVATGWIHKRTCTALDVGALQDFTRQRAGHGADSP